MDVGQMQRTWLEYTKSLFREGFLDGQFQQLQMLQDESNPNFIVEVVSLFFDDTEKLLNDLFMALSKSFLVQVGLSTCPTRWTGSRIMEQQGVDFKRVDACVHQLKGSSSSIGAQRVKNVCVTFRSFCEGQNFEGCLGCLEQVKHEYYLVKNKLENLFRLEQQIVAAGGSIPIEELSY